ncbi:hypothetical protein [Lyngbya aestuarii]|uniref:hypothetical protein n=1 Tax=Lyngbya aestuarii TaxID=118322 RepID=UPI00403DA752
MDFHQSLLLASLLIVGLGVNFPVVNDTVGKLNLSETVEPKLLVINSQESSCPRGSTRRDDGSCA